MTARLTPPWARMNATGTCSDRATLRVVVWRRPIDVSTWASTAASRPSIVTFSVTLRPGRILNERGETEIRQPGRRRRSRGT